MANCKNSLLTSIFLFLFSMYLLCLFSFVLSLHGLHLCYLNSFPELCMHMCILFCRFTIFSPSFPLFLWGFLALLKVVSFIKFWEPIIICLKGQISRRAIFENDFRQFSKTEEDNSLQLKTKSKNKTNPFLDSLRWS
jgi:hypothetical protein